MVTVIIFPNFELNIVQNEEIQFLQKYVFVKYNQNSFESLYLLMLLQNFFLIKL